MEKNGFETIKGILPTVIAVVALIVAIWQLQTMNVTLDSQLEESEQIRKLLDDTLSENRKNAFDMNTYGAIYVWDIKPLNKTVWTENLTMFFYNNYSFYTLNNLKFDMHLYNRSYCNYSNFTIYPKLRLKSIKNDTEKPPCNMTTITWDSINVKNCAFVTFQVKWDKTKLPRTNITPLKNDINTEVRGEKYSIINLPIIFAEPPKPY